MMKQELCVGKPTWDAGGVSSGYWHIEIEAAKIARCHCLLGRAVGPRAIHDVLRLSPASPPLSETAISPRL